MILYFCSYRGGVMEGGVTQKSRWEGIKSAGGLPSQMKAVTMEFAQSGEHGLRMLAFPAASLPFHAVMHNGVDAAFDGSAANGIPFLPEARIIHVVFASFKVSRRIPSILQA